MRKLDAGDDVLQLGNRNEARKKWKIRQILQYVDDVMVLPRARLLTVFMLKLLKLSVYFRIDFYAIR